MWENGSKVPPQSDHYVVGKGRIPAVDVSSLKCILSFIIIIINEQIEKYVKRFIDEYVRMLECQPQLSKKKM
jgi:hypothetical protein